MKGNPGVTTFRHAGRDQIYAFVRGDNGRLYVCFWNATPNVTSWQWADQGQPPRTRVNSSPITITSRQNDNAQEHYLHVFARGNDGHLYEHYWDGSRWVGWVDHGQPVWNTTIAMSPGVVTFRGRYYYEDDEFIADAADRLFAFVWGSDESVYRYLHRDKSWRVQGALPNPQAHAVSEPSVIKHIFQNTIPYVYAYVVANDGHLYVNHSMDWEARSWAWRDLGQPNANTTVTWLMKPGLVSFTHDGEYRIYAFVRGSDGHLWVHFWRDWRQTDAGAWADLGTPKGATVFSESGVVTFRHENTNRIYAFVRGSDNHLHVCYWNGVDSWLWTDLGRPTTGGSDVAASPTGGNTNVDSAPGVVTFRFVEPNRTTDRIYAFVRGGDNHLHVCYWNGVDLWLWKDLGVEPEPIPRLNFSTSSIDFGPVPVGDIKTRTFTIENTSGVPVTASFPASPQGAFQWDATNGVIAHGDRRIIEAEFSPRGEGQAQTTLRVTSDAIGSPHSISLRGRGVKGEPL